MTVWRAAICAENDAKSSSSPAWPSTYAAFLTLYTPASFSLSRSAAFLSALARSAVFPRSTTLTSHSSFVALLALSHAALLATASSISLTRVSTSAFISPRIASACFTVSSKPDPSSRLEALAAGAGGDILSRIEPTWPASLPSLGFFASMAASLALASWSLAGVASASLPDILLMTPVSVSIISACSTSPAFSSRVGAMFFS
mmetsp:Transcript_7606/g.18511  ORF Transcript_7606/g.18511 Transcript_7606/m.18511 type:complete len:203 (-) Transcript_7606:570-1178(-)